MTDMSSINDAMVRQAISLQGCQNCDRLRAEVVKLREQLEYIRLARTDCLCSGSWGVNHSEFHECSRCKRLRELKSAGREEVEK